MAEIQLVDRLRNRSSGRALVFHDCCLPTPTRDLDLDYTAKGDSSSDVLATGIENYLLHVSDRQIADKLECLY